MHKINFRIFILIILAAMLVGCSSMRRIERQSHHEVYTTLGLEESCRDNFALYKEISMWIHTPHIEGGLTYSGIDCSGLVYMVYKNVYGKNLERNSATILKKNCRKIRRHQLRQGDLVFFNTTGLSRLIINHVGIYLKDNKFVHTSTSRGVMISNLDEDYFRKTWVCGGRVKN
jgi:hypothetical protein